MPYVITHDDASNLLIIYVHDILSSQDILTLPDDIQKFQHHKVSNFLIMHDNASIQFSLEEVEKLNDFMGKNFTHGELSIAVATNTEDLNIKMLPALLYEQGIRVAEFRCEKEARTWRGQTPS